MQAWSGTADVFDGSDARKALHGGKSVRAQGDGYSNEVSGSAFAMEFHGGRSAFLEYADHYSLRRLATPRAREQGMEHHP
jgi:hypothetical protein